MGLHLCYELDLASETTEEAVLTLLEKLREAATRLPFKRVSRMFRLSGETCRLGPPGDRDELEWFLTIFTRGSSARYPDPEYPREVQSERALGFVVHPGARCEAAALGLARFPVPVRARRGDEEYETQGWHWHAMCKAQYASVVSDDHLIKCHLGLVDLLDAASRLGFGVTVRDETHYWETRDTARLVAEVHAMNRIVARIAGRVADAMPEGLRAGGSILDHPEFERLEMEE